MCLEDSRVYRPYNMDSVRSPVMPCVLYERLLSHSYTARSSHVNGLTLASDIIAPARSPHYVLHRYFCDMLPVNKAPVGLLYHLSSSVSRNLRTFLKKFFFISLATLFRCRLLYCSFEANFWHQWFQALTAFWHDQRFDSVKKLFDTWT